MDNHTPPEFPPEAPESLYVEMEPPAPSPFALALSELWHDRGLQFLLALTFLVNSALFVYLAIRFNNLSELLPLHFDAAGLPDRIDSKNGIYALPLIGVMILMLNTGLGIFIHHRERAIAILLAFGALSIQVLLWLAVINIAGLV